MNTDHDSSILYRLTLAADFKEQAKARQEATHKKWCCEQLRLNPSFTPAADDKKAQRGPDSHPIGKRIWHERNCFHHVGGTSKSNCNKGTNYFFNLI